MNYNEIYKTYQELKELLLQYKEAVIKKNLEQINIVNEKMIVTSEKIKSFDLENYKENFTQAEKENLKKLGKEIKNIHENNEIIIKHSLNVIKNLLSGILNISQNEKKAYNAKGKSYTSDESLNISSITEEA